MSTGLFRDYLSPDDVVTVNASGTALTVTKGDWIAYSGAYAVAANTGIGYYKASGIGVALANNPWWKNICHFAGKLALKLFPNSLNAEMQRASQPA